MFVVNADLALTFDLAVLLKNKATPSLHFYRNQQQQTIQVHRFSVIIIIVILVLVLVEQVSNSQLPQYIALVSSSSLY